jgi:ABC-type arginine transport system permease subunit
MQSTYWLDKVLDMISLYVNALLCTLQQIHIVTLTRMRAVRRENLFTFVIISRCILLRMTNVTEKIVEKIKIHIFFC